MLKIRKLKQENKKKVTIIIPYNQWDIPTTLGWLQKVAQNNLSEDNIEAMRSSEVNGEFLTEMDDDVLLESYLVEDQEIRKLILENIKTLT